VKVGAAWNARYPFARFEHRWMGLRLEPSHVLLARK
jgi:hypothetical protein